MYDNVGNQQGLFTFKYHWLIVTDSISASKLEENIFNITHVTAIVFDNPFKVSRMLPCMITMDHYFVKNRRKSMSCDILIGIAWFLSH